MLEFEIKSNQLSSSQIEPIIINSFKKKESTQRSILAWGEHCTECALPQCFKTCDLYQPRSDYKCRRFTEGIVKIDASESGYEFITRITFKPWSVLYTPGSSRVYDRADKIDAVYRFIAGAIRRIPSAWGIGRFRVPRLFYQFCKFAVRFGRKFSIGSAADYFLIEIYNPQDSKVNLTLVMKPCGKAGQIPFSRLFSVEPGYHEIYIHISDIKSNIDVDEPFDISLTPNTEEQTVTLYFGMIDFIKSKTGLLPQFAEKKIKCLVWDLDNTLWDNVLIESDPASINLKDHIPDILKRLDERGILLSIASKNNSQLACELLQKFGIGNYFLYPQIDWQQKSILIETIQKTLNIGMDSIAFIDDSNFERAEVARSNSEVQCIDAINYLNLLYYPGFAGSSSEDARNRRYYYQAEQKRNIELKDKFQDNYLSFLKECDIKLFITKPDETNATRINDLVQRTNQLNFSPNKYNRQQVEEILRDDRLDKYVLSASDRFGEYGIVGFAVVDRDRLIVTDMMFSCRIQMKRIEHAFLCYLMNRYKDSGDNIFKVAYSPTRRNSQCAKVLTDLGFRKDSSYNKKEIYTFDLKRSEISCETVVSVLEG
jgi:FkbH-like protein